MVDDTRLELADGLPLCDRHPPPIRAADAALNVLRTGHKFESALVWA